jgi:hypothetical protein
MKTNTKTGKKELEKRRRSEQRRARKQDGEPDDKEQRASEGSKDTATYTIFANFIHLAIQ